MKSFLCFTIRFLDPVPQFHGRGSDGDPEWPPTPLRYLQALVSAAATRWRENQFNDYARPALEWLQKLRPVIITPLVADRSYGFRMYVPNNSGDLMTASWARGDTDTSMAKFRVEKDVRPTQMSDEAMHFLFPLSESKCPHLEVLTAAARSITHLGWGVDMVAANAMVISEDEAGKLPGERWVPSSQGTPLRVPVAGTLDALLERHQKFLHRLDGDGFKPVPPLSAFETVPYARATDTPQRPWVAFQILDAEGERVRSFDTARRTRDVAAWVRNATEQVCGVRNERNELIPTWPFGDVGKFVHGHADAQTPLRGDQADARFQYLPLPTINSGVGHRIESVRRVLVAAPAGYNDRVDWIRRRLPGAELSFDGEVVGMLNLVPRGDWVLKEYTRTAQAWTTVTPVVLPRHDVETPAEIERLLRLAFVQAGVGAEIDDLQWRTGGFRAGVPRAGEFRTAKSMTGPRLHVSVTFRQPVAGPLAVGAGRYRGFGTFAAESRDTQR